MSKINEVAPPGWGHTKAEKEKTKPWKPKSKIGGTAAAFKRALDDGRFTRGATRGAAAGRGAAALASTLAHRLGG